MRNGALMSRVFITGASGFVGFHLVSALIAKGDRVTCFVREHSKTKLLEKLGAKIVRGNLQDVERLSDAMQNAEVVYHLAGLTGTLRSREFFEVNVEGTRGVCKACAKQSVPPVLVMTSSLAAAGPSDAEHPRHETEAENPVSYYGKSKLQAEQVARHYADRVPITIARPGIVFGAHDAASFEMFKAIAKMGIHFSPGLQDNRFALIHAADLASALIRMAAKGTRLAPESDGPTEQGVYFVADEVAPTYVELGRLMGAALGREHTWVLRMPMAAVWVVAACGELFGQLIGVPAKMGLDKAREASAGSWHCSTEALRRDTGFRVHAPLLTRLQETAEWYVENGWLGGNRNSSTLSPSGAR